ncbi:head maturation protease, ClpP-related [Nonomuraea sp. NPDC049714]|uniref:head maturation protease, ClpP-related n=1 Tax=Nonomuraea sp. NPDC049714 TaxID=3364357 RepID=UPI00379797C5
MRLKTARPQARIGAADWYRIRNLADNEAEVVIYDEIGWFGVSAQDFIRELRDVTANQITLRVNSPGGEVYDGIAIYNLLRSHPAHVTVYVDGIAASIASVIALAGDEIIMQPHSQMMIHNPWAMCIGNASDMADMAARLSKHADDIAAVYADRVGGTVDEWRERMAAETWFSAEETVEAGLADRVGQHTACPADGNTDAAVSNSWDLSVFRYAGREHAPAPVAVMAAASQTPPAEPAAGPQETQEGDTMSTLTEGLRERLGIADDAELDDDALLDAVDQALAERAEPSTAGPAPGPEPVAARIPDGMQLIDEATLAELRASAAQGVEARALQRTEARDQALNDAIRVGKFPPARRDHYAAAWDADPEGTRQLLDSLAEGLVPLADVGQPGGEPTDNGFDAEVDRLFTTPGRSA